MKLQKNGSYWWTHKVWVTPKYSSWTKMKNFGSFLSGWTSSEKENPKKPNYPNNQPNNQNQTTTPHTHIKNLLLILL